MKQARYWLLLVAAALMLLSAPAFAQGKKPATKPTTPAPAPAGGNDIDIDDPNAKKQPATPPSGGAGGDVDLDHGAGTPTPPPAGGGDTGAAGGGICEIDPSACPKQGDIKTLAARPVKAEVYAVQQIYALRRGRFEINPYWAFSLNDQFVTHPGPGLAVNYYLTNVLAIGINGTYYQPFNGDSDFNFQNRRATRLAVPLNEYFGSAAFNFTYVPMYGKFSGFGQFIFHYDGYLVGGVGAIATRPIAVIDPDNRKFDYEARIAFNVGFGLRIFLNRWFAATMELRDYIYVEQLESVTTPTNQQEAVKRENWFGEKPLTNNVQAQLGISIFLPFSWEYRLPK
jgi:outer membrane beta-barrel protein